MAWIIGIPIFYCLPCIIFVMYTTGDEESYCTLTWCSFTEIGHFIFFELMFLHFGMALYSCNAMLTVSELGFSYLLNNLFICPLSSSIRHYYLFIDNILFKNTTNPFWSWIWKNGDHKNETRELIVEWSCNLIMGTSGMFHVFVIFSFFCFHVLFLKNVFYSFNNTYLFFNNTSYAFVAHG